LHDNQHDSGLVVGLRSGKISVLQERGWGKWGEVSVLSN
jgi:hypothetical protein